MKKALIILISIFIINGSVHAEGLINDEYVQTFSSGHNYVIAIKEDGSLFHWGDDDDDIDTVPTGNDFIQVSSNHIWENHTTALREDGSLVSWGKDVDNQVTDTPTGTNFVQVSVGLRHATALKEDGSLISWGNNSDGAVTDTPTGTNFVQVACSLRHATAIKSDGSLVSWGNDDENQVTDTPTGTNFVQVTSGGSFVTALKSDGSLVSWGIDNYNQVTNTPTGTNFVQVSAGRNFATALKSDGSLVSWGRNTSNQISGTPTGTNFVQVWCGRIHGTAQKDDGSFVSWGTDGNDVVTDTPTTTDFMIPEETISTEDITNVQKTIQGYTDITVTWEDPEDSDQVNVYLDDEYIGNTTSEQYEFTGLDPATEYKVTLVNEFDGETAAGIDVVYETDNIPDISGLQLESNTSNSITLEWTGAEPSDKYNVYIDGELYTDTVITQQTILDLVPETNYLVKVTNVYEGYETTGKSETFGTLGSSDIVSNVHMEAKTESTIDLAWSEYEDSEYYKIYVDGNLNGTTETESYTVENLDPETTYSITVTAQIGTWESDESIPITVTTDITVEANNPENIYVKDSGTYFIELAWDYDPNNDGYDIYMEDVLVDTITETEIKIEGLDHESNYTIGVQAWKNHAGNTYYSDIIYGSYETKSIPPGATYLYIDELKMYSAVIGWDEVQEAEEYRIYIEDKLHSTYSPGTYQAEFDFRPGKEYEVYATIISEDTPESDKSNVLQVELPIPIHDTETTEMLARVTDLGRGIMPAILIIMALVIATKVTQIGLKYFARV